MIKDTVVHTTRVKLGWRDRLRALCGREVVTTSWIDVDADVSVMSSRGSTYVDHIMPARKVPGGMVETSSENQTESTTEPPQ